MRCPQCQNEVRDDARFCDACGTKLDGAAPAPPVAKEAERRQLTVVFCDLIGSTALSGKLDPEELRDVMSAYQHAASEAVRRMGGQVAIFLGDGILTYFGYPEAREDDVERAVRAALEIIRSVRHLNESWAADGRPKLAVRVAAHTGDAVVGELKASGAGIFGETPNLASRLQGLAPANGLVISDATYRLVQGLFLVDDLGSHELAGIGEPTRAWLVKAPSGVRSRFWGSGKPTPFVGREREMDLLWSRWRRAASGEGQAVLVVGEAGLGKSRLGQAIHQRLSNTPHTWLECGGSPYTQDSAFGPVIQLQASALRFSSEMAPEEKLGVLEAAMRGAGLPEIEAVPLLARLHSIEIPPGSPYVGAIHEGFSADAVRRRTMDVARDWLLQIAQQQPVVMFFEDLHWADPSSLDLVGEVIARISSTGVLLLMTSRPELDVPWDAPELTRLELARLDSESSGRFVRRLAGRGTLSDEQVSSIVGRTDGVPLFIEEMTKAALESGANGAKGNELGVPATLKGLLTARIDRLGPAKEVAHIGATIGREFSHDLIKEVWEGDADELEEGLTGLARNDLVDRTATSLSTTFVFRHALIQDAAYETLLKSTRARYHRRIAEVLDARFPETARTQPELLAHHFTRAGDHDTAIPHWLTAGQRASARSANVEAERHLRSGLDCIAQLPEGTERATHELVFRTRLGANLISVRGYGAEEVHDNISRAQELCDQLRDSPFVFPVLYNLWVFHLMRSDLRTVEYADRLLEMAERTDPDSMLMWGHIAQAITHYWRADFGRACAHAEACRDSYRFDPSHIALFGDDPGAYGFVYDGLAQWFLGFPEKADAFLEQAIETARSMRYAFTVAGTEAFVSQLRHFERDVAAAAKNAQETVAMCMEQRFPVFLGSSLAHLGWAMMRMGQLEPGMAQIDEGVGLYRATGAVLNTHYFMALRAEASLLRSRRDEGLGAVSEGLGIVDRHLDRIFVPELHRLRGELLLLEEPDEGAAEEAYRTAMKCAGPGGSRMLELRAACSYARLMEARDERERARNLLGPLYDAFTEGFESQDLADARVQLERLSG